MTPTDLRTRLLAHYQTIADMGVCDDFVHALIDDVCELRSQLNALLSASKDFASIKANDGDDFSDLDAGVIIRCEVTSTELYRIKFEVKRTDAALAASDERLGKFVENEPEKPFYKKCRVPGCNRSAPRNGVKCGQHR